MMMMNDELTKIYREAKKKTRKQKNRKKNRMRKNIIWTLIIMPLLGFILMRESVMGFHDDD